MKASHRVRSALAMGLAALFLVASPGGVLGANKVDDLASALQNDSSFKV